MTSLQQAFTAARPSASARARMLSVRGEPLFTADWDRVLMIHYEVDPRLIQRYIPFELDLYDGRAFVSLVAFTMRAMRPTFGGDLGALLFSPIANHEFLNVRTYVRHGAEAGIYFLAEWLPNRLSVALGPLLFGLPYRLGAMEYHHDFENGTLCGSVKDRRTGALLQYESTFAEPLFRTLHSALGIQPIPSAANSLDEWLMERYTAFTAIGKGPKRFFRVWHSPWPQVRLDVNVTNAALLESNWPFFKQARHIGANFSPGLNDVWMGRPQFLNALPLIEAASPAVCSLDESGAVPVPSAKEGGAPSFQRTA